ncbi:apolipoprotein N-acyltransferase [Halomonas halocynthiae]|uniref:apolipoprotein N-acyltransferase n=1 Tax=Halomonas halocynthiae TaxID=176290 RepID=UPI0003F8BDE3|nr:apolipoprotein N-acyltransferase [Halomonas halocynthiae]
MTAFLYRPVASYLAALIAGLLTTLSAAPFHLWWLAPIAAGLVYVGLGQLTPRQAGFKGWCYGLGLFGSGASWVYVSIHDYGYTGMPLALALTTLFVTAMALFIAVPLWLYRRFTGSRLSVLTFAGVWVLSEALRTWLFTGFPWLLLGSGQLDGPLAAWTPIGGVYLLSLVTALSGTLGVTLLRRHYWAALPLTTLWLLPLSLSLSSVPPWTHPTGEPVRVALLQGNLDQAIKWTQEGQRTAANTYLTLTANLNEPVELVIWPEAALPMLQSQAQPVFERATQLLPEGSGLISGILRRDAQGNIYNSVISMGAAQGSYDKRHLVPFGEYLPLDNLLRGTLDFFDLPLPVVTPGQSYQPVMHAGETRIGNAICYEIIYADLVAKQARHSDVILTLSNDSWFGGSIGPLQHLQMARLRALENGRYVVRATSNGVTAIIDSQGNITQQLPQFEMATLIGEFQPMQGLTPFSRTGSWPVWLMAALMLLPGLRLRHNA